jgi:hypothetical protein
MMSTSPHWHDSLGTPQDVRPNASLRERATRLGWSIALVGLAAAAALVAPIEARSLDPQPEPVPIHLLQSMTVSTVETAAPEGTAPRSSERR